MEMGRSKEGNWHKEQKGWRKRRGVQIGTLSQTWENPVFFNAYAYSTLIQKHQSFKGVFTTRRRMKEQGERGRPRECPWEASSRASMELERLRCSWSGCGKSHPQDALSGCHRG
jgi:hypothetical protein